MSNIWGMGVDRRSTKDPNLFLDFNAHLEKLSIGRTNKTGRALAEKINQNKIIIIIHKSQQTQFDKSLKMELTDHRA